MLLRRFKFIQSLLSTSLACFLLSGCSNELNILDSKKEELAYVMALLDGADSIHTIRVNKAFVDPKTSAFTLAQRPDSLFFKNLNVQVQELASDGRLLKTFLLTENRNIAKDSGLFAYPNQVVYQFASHLNEKSTYQLIVTTPSNKIVRGKTVLLGESFLYAPRLGASVNWDDPEGVNLTFLPPAQAKLYEIHLRIHYTEYLNRSNQPHAKRFLDYKATQTQTLARTDGNERITIRLYSRQMFAFMNQNIPIDPTIERSFDGVEFRIITATSDFDTFLQINSSTNLSQVQSPYTNLEGGLGLFTSRNSYPVLRRLQQANNYPTNSPTFRRSSLLELDSLTQNYPQLNFKR